MSEIWIAATVAVGASAASAYVGAGKKPKIPGVPQINPTDIQRQAIQGNMANLPAALELASAVNKGNQDELDKVRERTLPGGKAASQKFIMDQLMGVADVSDTQSAIRNATASGFNLGTGGSQFSKFGVIGHLGRTVAQQRQQGLSNFANFASFMEAPRFNPATMFLSAEGRLNAQLGQNKMNYDAALAQAAVDAQPSAGMKALSAGLGSVGSIAGMVAGAGISKQMGFTAQAGGMAGQIAGGAASGAVSSYVSLVPKAYPGAGDSLYNQTTASAPNWYNTQGWNTNPSGSGPGYGY